MRRAVIAVLACLAAVPSWAIETTRVWVEGNEFKAELTDGTTLAGAALVGAVVSFADGRGGVTRVRIDRAERDTRDPAGEVMLYELSTEGADGRWQNLCGADPDGRHLAFPLPGVWSEDGRYIPSATEFSLTCTGGAIGKCVRFGYKPWKEGLEPYYQTCVRMVRADYCGDGTGWTENGMLIDIDDDRLIQRSDGDPRLAFEAAWGPDGALCVAHPRVPRNGSLEDVVRACPARLAGKVGPACSEENARATSGARLFNRSKF